MREPLFMPLPTFKGQGRTGRVGWFLPVGFRQGALQSDIHPCALGVEQRHSVGLDAIFQVEKGSPFAREAPRRFSGTGKIVGLENAGSVCDDEAETIGGVP